MFKAPWPPEEVKTHTTNLRRDAPRVSRSAMAAVCGDRFAGAVRGPHLRSRGRKRGPCAEERQKLCIHRRASGVDMHKTPSRKAEKELQKERRGMGCMRWQFMRDKKFLSSRKGLWLTRLTPSKGNGPVMRLNARKSSIGTWVDLIQVLSAPKVLWELASAARRRPWSTKVVDSGQWPARVNHRHCGTRPRDRLRGHQDGSPRPDPQPPRQGRQLQIASGCHRTLASKIRDTWNSRAWAWLGRGKCYCGVRTQYASERTSGKPVTELVSCRAREREE
ncbi:hypothetical protein GGX14DRAFT_402427 [Mycena pura]|uniref:Uncharacterized protein n=1 Tax=Mycena pura TaxID=153505 RepID=A0AAD6V0T7_9AGAR|nr:hypothetical protein GGX14DRAFT_402427 [Mycena pura]